MEPPLGRNRLETLGLLWGLYFVQGLPFGFQSTAIPVLIYESGGSRTAVGLSGMLALPWLLKPLAAPWVDRYHHPRWGRRRSWLLPLQGLLVAATVAVALWSDALVPTLVLVLAMNAFAATLDIAVDGLAVDCLQTRDLGRGNSAQVVGYKLGMLAGGALLLWVSEAIGLRLALLAVAASAAVVMGATWLYREPAPAAATASPATVRAILTTLCEALRVPGTGPLLVAIATYKLGESMADVMFKPFVLDAGFSRGDVGKWVAGLGGVCSIAGSLLGGWLASTFAERGSGRGFVRAVALTAGLRVGPLAGQWWLARTLPGTEAIVAVTAAEHFAGGALTTAMFALMMSRVDPRIGASHFTFFAVVEVLGKAPSGWLSGLVADRYGYEPVFALATVLSAAYLLVLIPLHRLSARP